MKLFYQIFNYCKEYIGFDEEVNELVVIEGIDSCFFHSVWK